MREADQRAHARVLGARVADPGLGEPFAQCLFERIHMFGRGHRAADRGAFLARLHRHLARDLLDEEIEFGGSGRGIGAEDRGVEAVALGDETHGFARDHRVRLELHRGLGGAGEADDVLQRQMVEQVADAAHHELKRALG